MHMRTYNGNDTFPRHVTREPCSVTLFITSRSFVPVPNIPSSALSPLATLHRTDLNFIQIPLPRRKPNKRRTVCAWWTIRSIRRSAIARGIVLCAIGIDRYNIFNARASVRGRDE